MAVVCMCHDVADRAIARVIGRGARTVEEVAERCGVGQDCGCCLATVEAMLADVDAVGRDPTAAVA